MIFQTRSEREVPTEIDRFVARLPYSCSEPEFVHSRQSAVREWVTEVAGAYENGWDLVRSAARAKLGDDDASMVERALTCLFVTGTSADVAAVELLAAHPDEAVQKAARTCLFEIRRRQ